MGQVFTWPQVRDRQVPHLEDFTDVLNTLRETLSREQSVRGSLVCGSVVRGDHNRRSDIDCVVIFDAAQSKRAFAVIQNLSVSARDRNVPLAFILSDTRLAATRMHHFGPSFIEHVHFSIDGGGLIKGNPLDLLVPSVSREAGIEEYLRFKMHYLQTHWAAYAADDEKDRTGFLKKSLEAPLHVARKTLSWFGPLAGDSKLQIRRQYASIMPVPLVESLHELVEEDAQYSAELERQLVQPHKLDYYTACCRIEERVPQVLDFVTQNLLFIDSKAR